MPRESYGQLNWSSVVEVFRPRMCQSCNRSAEAPPHLVQLIQILRSDQCDEICREQYSQST